MVQARNEKTPRIRRIRGAFLLVKSERSGWKPNLFLPQVFQVEVVTVPEDVAVFVGNQRPLRSWTRQENVRRVRIEVLRSQGGSFQVQGLDASLERPVIVEA